MCQTNTWSSKAWFKAAGEHFNNAKSSLPEVNKQTGMNFVVSGGWGLAYSKEWMGVKIPGQLAAAPAQFAKSTLEGPCNIVGNRAAVTETTKSYPTQWTVKHQYSTDNNDYKSVTLIYKYNLNSGKFIISADQQERLTKINSQIADSRDKLKSEFAPEESQFFQNAQLSIPDSNSVVQNKEIKDWKTVANMADKASGALVNLGTGIGLYAFSNGITTAVNSLIEGKGIKKSLGNGLHAGKSTIQNTCYGIVEGVAAAVDLGVGTTLLCCEATGFVIEKAWNNTLGRLPHDNEPTSDVSGDIIDTDQA